MGIPGPVKGAIVVVCTALVALVIPLLINLDELPANPLERLAAYQRARDEDEERVEEALTKKAIPEDGDG